MKLFILFLFFISFNSFAQYGTFHNRYEHKSCAHEIISDNGLTLDCKWADGYDEINNLYFGAPIIKLPSHIENKILSVSSDFNLLPDADTNLIYRYNRTLLGDRQIIIGYMVIEGYENEEIGMRFKLTHRYNLLGKLVQAKVEIF